jgi:hypothetical protein
MVATGSWMGSGHHPRKGGMRGANWGADLTAEASPRPLVSHQGAHHPSGESPASGWLRPSGDNTFSVASGLAKGAEGAGEGGLAPTASPGAGRMPDNRRNDPQQPVRSAPNCIDVLGERRKLIPAIRSDPSYQPRVSDQARNIVNGSGLWDRADDGVHTPQAAQAHQPIHYHGACRPRMPSMSI